MRKRIDIELYPSNFSQLCYLSLFFLSYLFQHYFFNYLFLSLYLLISPFFGFFFLSLTVWSLCSGSFSLFSIPIWNPLGNLFAFSSKGTLWAVVKLQLAKFPDKTVVSFKPKSFFTLVSKEIHSNVFAEVIQSK